MILEFAQWVVPRLIHMRVCHGEDRCKAYDSQGNFVVNIHTDARWAFAFLRILTGFVKIIAWCDRCLVGALRS